MLIKRQRKPLLKMEGEHFPRPDRNYAKAATGLVKLAKPYFGSA